MTMKSLLACTLSLLLFSTGVAATAAAPKQPVPPEPLSVESLNVLKVEGLDITQVLLVGSAELEISSGDTTELTMRGSGRDVQRHPFYVDGDRLVLGRSKSESERDFGSLKFKLVAKHLESIKLVGSGEIYVRPMTVSELTVALDGSGNIKIFSLHGAEKLRIALSGSGDIQVAELQAADLELVVSGAGDIDIGELQAQLITLSMKGAGDINLTKSGIAEAIEVNLVGAGDVNFRRLDLGSAEINIVGSGDVVLGEVSLSIDVSILGSGDASYAGEAAASSSSLGSGKLNHR